MAANTDIELADNTFNPWRGCTKVSAGVPYHIASKKGGLMSELPPDLALREVPQ